MADAAAQYKKQDGIVSVSADGKTVAWKSATGALPPLSIAIADIANLQQTPATAAKASIKIVVKESAPQAGNHTFTFTSAAARDDQQTITGSLRKWIESLKQQAAPSPAPAAAKADGGDGGASASMAMAQTVTAAGKSNEDTYDDAKLLADTSLQMSLLNSSPALRQRFDRALLEKPDSVGVLQFSMQFWSTRVHMLRSHATERSQATGTYNVLSVIKSKSVNGTLMLNLTKEQIELLFRQHPIVQKAYNENVPPLTESDFWERFFHSRLMKKLKGERIQDKDVLDPKLDKYLSYDETADSSLDLLSASIPNFINIEANENNHSQKQGNRPDFTMNPTNYEKAPILRVLNRMSEKMMKDVPPSDVSRHGPAGMDEETYKELQLRDLQFADDDNRVVLKVQDQSRFFSAGQSVHTSTSAATYTKRTPAQALSTLQQDLRKFDRKSGQTSKADLHSLIEINDESSSDEEGSAPKKAKVGSKSSRKAASSQILSALKQRRLHNDDFSSSSVPASERARELQVSEAVLDSLTMTHNTTVEFLHYFWAVFYSGDPDRANEIARLIETLDKSLDRIKAVADMAEADRTARIEQARKENELSNQRERRKRKFDPEVIKGGAKAINQIVDPLLRAIDAARRQYQKALQEQVARNSATVAA
ncbi:General transcription and DNA repair factor IIH subunit tcf-29 [Curvularia clavata]|uniref:General transcription and DNA repair factor IIH subunit tcf-29 n=1 Tax=Curvularia clavata TaxID=95742 RepID=A0A9Q8ZJB1_CURCL|nr:General transcription and DNA repair factor IIH subunit tcf-29 [Curvularia clavata]